MAGRITGEWLAARADTDPSRTVDNWFSVGCEFSTEDEWGNRTHGMAHVSRRNDTGRFQWFVMVARYGGPRSECEPRWERLADGACTYESMADAAVAAEGFLAVN